MEDQNPFLSQQPATDDSNPFIKGNSKALATAQASVGDEDYNGLCEKFAEQVSYGKTGMFPTANDAWNHYAQNGQARPDVENAPMGSLLYFANGGAGHVAITDGKGNITGATDNGVKTLPLQEWVKSTGQKILGFVTP